MTPLPRHLDDPAPATVDASPFPAPVHLALCEDDLCPWKHRGVTSQATTEEARTHVRHTGHAVVLYENYARIGRSA